MRLALILQEYKPVVLIPRLSLTGDMWKSSIGVEKCLDGIYEEVLNTVRGVMRDYEEVANSVNMFYASLYTGLESAGG